MKIALICPSNLLYMPYVDNYIKILKENNIDYTIINWDRFHIDEKDDKVTYRDNKIGHQRGYFEYIKFSRFVTKHLYKERYNKLIVFGLQISHFLKKYLLKNYKDRYIIDIRDHNKIINFSKFKKLIEESSFTTISSPGYKEWLPKTKKYIVNHNTNIEDLDGLEPVIVKDSYENINVTCIGAIRDQDVNIKLISFLASNDKFELFYHGEGYINNNIISYIKENKISNVTFTGRYKKENEALLYRQSDIINVLRFNDGINNKTALPNRLYNSAIYAKPMLALKDTYMSTIIERYNLGLVISTFDNIEYDIQNYLQSFDFEKYNIERCKFLGEIIEENKEFTDNLLSFFNFSSSENNKKE